MLDLVNMGQFDHINQIKGKIFSDYIGQLPLYSFIMFCHNLPFVYFAISFCFS